MDLSGYINILAEHDQLAEVSAEVSCQLELPALCRREFRKHSGGKALLFQQLAESEMSLAANLFGSEERLKLLLRCSSLSEFAQQIRNYLTATKAPLKQQRNSVEKPLEWVVSSHIDATELPIIRSWPNEIGGYLTLALTITRDPRTGVQNVGLYRAQVQSENRIALNFAPSSGAAQHLQTAEEMQQNLPVALVLGGDPVWLWAASAPLPEGIDEFAFCSDFFCSNVRFVDCATLPLQVPATAEVVIEGEIVPGDYCAEGPFGNHTGQYVTRADCPQLKVSAILHKPEPIVPVTVVGPPPSENIYLARASEVLIRETVKLARPDVVDLQMPQDTIFHGASLISIRSASNDNKRELIDYLWRESPLKRGRFLLLVDEDIELSNLSRCWWRAINQLQAGKVYQDEGRMLLDITGVDPASLVVENQQTLKRLEQRKDDYQL